MKKNLLFVLLMLTTFSVATADIAYRYGDSVVTVRGDAIGGATVVVYENGTTTKATLYNSVNTATGELSNPVYTDTYGRFYFYTAPGLYDLVISGPGITTYEIDGVDVALGAETYYDIFNSVTDGTDTVRADGNDMILFNGENGVEFDVIQSAFGPTVTTRVDTGATIYTDAILLDTALFTDTVYERGSGTGVTVDGALLKDTALTIDHILMTPGTAPTPAAGELYYDLSDNVLKVYNGSDWVSLAGTETANPYYHQTWMLPITGAPSPAYIGGFYDFDSTYNDFDPAIQWGITDVPAAAHFMIVTGSLSLDEVTIQITGDRITDSSAVQEGYVDTIVIPASTPANTYFETSSKWLGKVDIELLTGTPTVCNYGWCKYWDNGNTDFTIVGGEAIWMGDSTADIDIVLYHHKTTGWTYRASGGPTFIPNELFRMSDFYGSNIKTDSNDYGCFKRAGASYAIDGSASEGVIVGFEFSAGACIEYGQITIEYTQ